MSHEHTVSEDLIEVRPQGEPWNPDRRQHSLSGSFRIHRQFGSQHLEHARDVIVYLPPDYEAHPERRYPVLYMHDGNNLFDTATAFSGVEWQVDEHIESLIASGRIEDVIVVGIYNTPARNFEYTWNSRLIDDSGASEGGGGARYARFLVEELKPMIDQAYRTRPGPAHTAVAGSSLGGLISFYLGLHFPDVFGLIGIVSPSLWWNDGQPLADVAGMPDSLRIWVDIGAEESRTTVDRIDAFVAGLEARGYVHGRNLLFWVDRDGDHSEAAWASRVDKMLCFFFTPADWPRSKPS